MKGVVIGGGDSAGWMTAIALAHWAAIAFLRYAKPA